MDPKILEEKNYEGTRLFEIEDKNIVKLHGELKKFQLEANPTLEKMEKLTPTLDPFYTELGKLEKQKADIKEKMAEPRAKYDALLDIVQKIDQRAQLVKNKMQPAVNSIVDKELGEFEKANQLVEKEGKIYVEIMDELEEKIKAIRETKLKK